MNRLSYAQVFSTEVYPGTTINFPAMPELLDTRAIRHIAYRIMMDIMRALLWKMQYLPISSRPWSQQVLYDRIWNLAGTEQGCQLFNQSNIRAGDINAGILVPAANRILIWNPLYKRLC